VNAAFIGLLGVVVGAGISTGVAYLLAVRKDATDTRNWRRDHVLQVYTDFIRACSVVMDEADNIYEMESSSERVAQGKLLFERVAEMYRLSDRVMLLAPADLHKPMNDLAYYYGHDIAARAQKSPIPSREEWKTIRSRAPALYMSFIMKARNDLGVHEPLYSLEEWKKNPGR
jgi:hypothetical protein